MNVTQKTGRLADANQKNGKRPSPPSRSSSAAVRGKVTTFLVCNRSTVMLVVIGLVLLMEVFEHLLISNLGEAIHFWFDTIVYTLLFPVTMWFMLGLLENTEMERALVTLDSNQRSIFSQRLGDAQTWDTLVSEVVTYANQVAPRANATLFVYNHHTIRLEPVALCTREGYVTLKPPVSISPDSLPIGSLPQLLLQNDNLFLSSNGTISFPGKNMLPQPVLPPHRYDFPITRNDQEIGVIKLEYPLGNSPTQDEIRALMSVGSLIALALEGGILQNLAAEQAQASEVQRQEIAQHLHDTLAQNISYLRLKLDQLTGENSIREIGMVLEELERMRTTAEEAYQQVRNTLDELNPSQAEDLPTLLVRQARIISQRAGFKLRSSQVGAPYIMPPAVRQQVLYIVREALHNIEKHAGASQVQFQMLWLENEMIIKITDNGVGFGDITIKEDGHYGLWIMQHRAQEIGGTLKIIPADDHGTEVTLWVPKSV